MELINFTKENGVGKIVFNRPEKFNSFVRDMMMAFQAALDDCKQDESVRCILVTANGKAFCAGQDLGEAIDENNGLDLEQIVNQHYNPCIKRLREIEKPIVAAVNGVAAGAGANIALACDIVVAKESANFIQAFSKIGLIPDSGGTYTLPRLIGLQKATALMMLGEKVSAVEAERLGMIYKFFPDDTFETEVDKIVSKLASMPTKGLGLTKRALNLSLTNGLDTQLDIEEHLQAEAGESEDYKEGVNAFLEKRKPTFVGK